MNAITTEKFNYLCREILLFCKKACDEIEKHRNKHSKQLIYNMAADNWPDVKQSLMNKLNCGEYPAVTLVFDRGKVIAIAAVEPLSKSKLIIFKRLYVIRKYINQPIISTYILPSQKKWATENGFKTLVGTINMDNKALRNLLERIKIGKGMLTTHSSDFKSFEYKGIQKINHTEQYIYEYNIG